ncbi:MAG: FAD:protein FMN transferase [Rhodothermales bacterium]|nr:FAD:protein FMN transferase [Rhodothermales bacterium]
MRWPASVLLCWALLAATLADVASGQARFRVEGSEYLMGTHVTIVVLSPDVVEGQQAIDAALEEIRRVERLLSTSVPGSDVHRINHAEHDSPVDVADETIAILERSRSWAIRLEGLFDITVVPAMELWGLGAEEQDQPPSSDDLRRALDLIDYREVLTDVDAGTAMLGRKGMKLELGGIGKGYGVDRAAITLEQAGIADYLINAGGDIRVLGRPEPGRPWRVGIRHPRDPGALLARVEMESGAVATSGDYERFVEWDGVRHPHIVNPLTGRPVLGVQSATVLAETAEEADVLATYLFILGRVDLQQPALLVRTGCVDECLTDPEVLSNAAGLERFQR